MGPSCPVLHGAGLHAVAESEPNRATAGVHRHRFEREGFGSSVVSKRRPNAKASCALSGSGWELLEQCELMDEAHIDY